MQVALDSLVHFLGLHGIASEMDPLRTVERLYEREELPERQLLVVPLLDVGPDQRQRAVFGDELAVEQGIATYRRLQPRDGLRCLRHFFDNGPYVQPPLASFDVVDSGEAEDLVLDDSFNRLQPFGELRHFTEGAGCEYVVGLDPDQQVRLVAKDRFEAIVGADDRVALRQLRVLIVVRFEKPHARTDVDGGQ